MICKINKCGRDATYFQQQVCQKHYFRFMRNGSYDLPIKTNKYRVSNPAGYQKVREPDHPLANGYPYVYEHRVVLYNYLNGKISCCELCGDSITWESCHVDHKDCDVTNNEVSNLRATCRPCNVYRGHTPTSMGKSLLTVDGRTLSAQAWARQEGVVVSGATIRRRKSMGMSDYDSVFSPRITHHSTNTKRDVCKYDDTRGI
jgi:hypothetical protein